MNRTRIGILGGGQLARMLALSGYPLGLEFVFYDPEPSVCSGQVGRLINADYGNEIALDEFCSEVDCITLDFENVPVETVRFANKRKPVFPSADVLEIAQDRLLEKQFFQSCGIPVPEFHPVNSASELMFAAKRCNHNAFLKTRRMGYDGKGQYRIQSPADIKKVPEAQLNERDFILEQGIDFVREVSVIVARSVHETAVYPLCENRHKNGILTTTIAPANPSHLDEKAVEYALTVAEKLNYIGVLVIEFFQTEDAILANEMAPRVHNSGHWTIEGAHTSQFENHLRAGLGLPLGDTGMQGMAAMINWIGALPENYLQLNEPNLHWHAYGKAPRLNRKVGHATLLADDSQALHDRIVDLVKKLGVSL